MNPFNHPILNITILNPKANVIDQRIEINRVYANVIFSYAFKKKTLWCKLLALHL